MTGVRRVAVNRPDLRLPAPPLRDVTTGIELRPWRDGDAEALAAAWSVPDVAGQAAVPGAGSAADAARWIAAAPARLADGVALDLVIGPIDGPDAPWGEVGLNRLALRSGDRERVEWEVGWWVAPERRGRGVAGAAAALLVGWAVADLGLERVVARIGRGHRASEAVATAVGLAPIGAFDGTRDLWTGPV